MINTVNNQINSQVSQGNPTIEENTRSSVERVREHQLNQVKIHDSPKRIARAEKYYNFASDKIIGKVTNAIEGSRSEAQPVGSLNEIDPVDIVEIGSVFELFSGVAYNGVKFYGEAEAQAAAEKVIHALEEELLTIVQLQSEALQTNDLSLIENLNEHKAHVVEQKEEVEKFLEGIKENKSDLKKDILIETGKTTLGVTKEAAFTAHELLDETASAAEELATEIVGCSLQSVQSVMSLILKSKDIMDLVNKSKAIQEEKANLLTEIENAKTRGDEVTVRLLEMRVQNLDLQQSEASFQIAKKVISLVGSIAGSAAAIKAIAVAIGLTLGATLGTAASASGIGAAVISAVILLAGIGFVAYKNRHTIAHYAQLAPLYVKDFAKDQEINNYNRKTDSLVSSVTSNIVGIQNESEQKEELTKEKFLSSALPVAKNLEDLKKQKSQIQNGNSIFKSFQNYWVDSQIHAEKNKLKGMVESSTVKSLQLSDSIAQRKERLNTGIHVDLRNVSLQTVEKKEEKAKIQEEQQKLKDEYFYGRYLKFFPNTMTIEDLKSFHMKMIEEVNKKPLEGFKAIRAQFENEREKVGGNMNLNFFRKTSPVSTEENNMFFTEMMKGLVAGIK